MLPVIRSIAQFHPSLGQNKLPLLFVLVLFFTKDHTLMQMFFFCICIKTTCNNFLHLANHYGLYLYLANCISNYQPASVSSIFSNPNLCLSNYIHNLGAESVYIKSHMVLATCNLAFIHNFDFKNI